MPTVTLVDRPRQLLALACLTLLTACGGPASNGSTPDAAESAAPAPAPSAPQAPAEPAQPAAAPAAAATPEAGVQESAEPAASDGGEQLKLASAAPPAGEPKWRFREGEHFTVLTAAQGTSSAPGKIEVAEAFWYGCPHCYEFDPKIMTWVAGLPGDVVFVRLPVMWNPTNQIHARIFYTAQALGKLEEIHTAVFREMHVEKNMVTDEAEIQALFERNGVSAADFQKTFRSFAVEGQLKRAKDLTARYQIRSVPQLIVNGKYAANGPGIHDYDEMLAVVSELIERERRR
ncbi:MAG: thiol:disulfide interchange protein DsbA/DsbL [Gammaproteobacteria bacterium]|nr:thiol:disulfide interchange protein DsbA/DsbL [Gammaproteobacteria bacterium]